MGRPATDKKDRLVEAAMRRFHHDGVAASSLSAVANDAGVAPGNVFYYFRSKEALTGAVIDRWCALVRANLDDLDSGAAPRDRLCRFLANAAGRAQGYADFGCPLAALNSDLRDATSSVAADSGRPLALLRAWLATQFEQLTGSDAAMGHAGSCADFCLASLQGSYALAHATGDARIVSHSVDHLLGWIDRVGRDAA